MEKQLTKQQLYERIFSLCWNDPRHYVLTMFFAGGSVVRALSFWRLATDAKRTKDKN